jgi:hypothetical protein
MAAYMVKKNWVEVLDMLMEGTISVVIPQCPQMDLR